MLMQTWSPWKAAKMRSQEPWYCDHVLSEESDDFCSAFGHLSRFLGLFFSFPQLNFSFRDLVLGRLCVLGEGLEELFYSSRRPQLFCLIHKLLEGKQAFLLVFCSPKSLDRQGNKPLLVFECKLRSPCDMASSVALNFFGGS